MATEIDVDSQERMRAVNLVRAQYATGLKGDMDSFIKEASLADILFLSDIISYWGSNHSEGEESVLPSAVSWLFDRAGEQNEAKETGEIFMATAAVAEARKILTMNRELIDEHTCTGLRVLLDGSFDSFKDHASLEDLKTMAALMESYFNKHRDEHDGLEDCIIELCEPSSIERAKTQAA